MKTFLYCIASLLSLVCYSCSSHAQPGTLLPPAEFKKKVESSSQPIIVDVRTPEEYSEGHLPDAVNMDWDGDHFDQQIQSLDKHASVFVYCYGGGRSSGAAKEMRKQGFKNVYDLKGGFSAWKKAGLPEVK
jgi:rhodanese-related sulfurtransferase